MPISVKGTLTLESDLGSTNGCLTSLSFRFLGIILCLPRRVRLLTRTYLAPPMGQSGPGLWGWTYLYLHGTLDVLGETGPDQPASK